MSRTRLSLSTLSALLVAAPVLSVPLQAELPQQRPDFSPFTSAQGARIIPSEIREDDRVTLNGNVHAGLLDAQEIGMTDPALPMEKMILTFKMAPDAKYRLDQLLAAQQDPKSPYYHQWLKPEEFGQMFGPSQADIDAVASWLAGKGFKVDELSTGRLTLTFSGSVAQVQSAFRVSIRDYRIKGEVRHANAEDPSIPAALSNVVAGVVSLHNIPRRNYNTGIHKLSAEDASAVAAKGRGIIADWKGTANSAAGVFTSPVDWATIYNANSTFSTNGKGSGVTIGIVGRTNPGTANWSTFRSQVGLPVNTPTIVVNGTNPGDLGASEDGEADLDAEWSGGVAPLATVKFVASKSTSSTDGVDLSAQYIVNHNLADVMSTSFGQCESSMGSTENTFYNNLWSQAASQGITSCVSTGDSGPSGCDGGSATTASGYAVNGLASTPYNIAVGATQLSNSSSYWNASGNATGYIPEAPWNESGTVSGGSGLWSTSSGASTTYTKPSWQVAPGVPSANQRFMPDICLDGSDMFFGNYGMLVYSQGAMGTTGGTSAASPSFAGVMALVVQKYGRQGNANTKLYTLGKAQYSGAGTASMFHDINSGNNNVPGLTGFTAATGWDEATGLGTPDVTALVNNWVDTTPPANVTVSETGTSGTITLTGSATDNIGVDHITFLVDGVAKGTVNAAPYTTTINSTLLLNGSHSVVAQAYDAAGNNTQSAPFSFSLTNPTPTGTFDVVQGSSSVSGATVSGTVTCTVTASDGSGPGVKRVTFYIDGKYYTSVFSAPYTATVDTSKLSNGSHDFLAYAMDNTGNWGYLTPEHVFVTTNNVVTIPPTGSASVTGTSGTITLNATPTDQSGSGIKSVTFYVDGIYYATKASAPYSVSLDSTGLSNGTHHLLAFALDNNGNMGYLAHWLAFTTNNATVDTTAPTLHNIIVTGTTGTVTFSSEVWTNHIVLKVEFYVDGTLVGTSTRYAYSTTWASTPGSHSLVVKAYDDAGNVGTSTPFPFTTH